jgi:hypothetical protein
MGKNIKAAAIALLTVHCLISTGGAADKKLNGQFWQEMPKAHKAVYMVGYMQGLGLRDTIADETVDKLSKCTKDWNAGQRVAILDKYLKDSP